jgi:hypothetical protein
LGLKNPSSKLFPAETIVSPSEIVWFTATISAPLETVKKKKKKKKESLAMPFMVFSFGCLTNELLCF